MIEQYPPLTLAFLRSKGYPEDKIARYYDILARFRARIHPGQELAPDPVEYYVDAPDGVRVFAQEFVPPDARAVLLCQPGNSCQGDLYYMLADHLYPKGVAVVAVDNRGHGRSGPRWGDLDHPRLMYPVYDALLARFPGIPHHVFGESLGTAMLAGYLVSNSPGARTVQSAILSSSVIKLRIDLLQAGPVYPVAKVLLGLLRVLSLDRPFLFFKPDFRPTYFREYHEHDQIDPIRAPKSTARHLANLLGAIRALPCEASHVTVPILFMQGTGDPLLDPSGTLAFFRGMKGIHRRIHLFRNADHSLLFDKNSQASYGEIERWILGGFISRQTGNEYHG